MGMKIVIIGGGFSGTALATALLRHGPGDLTIHLIEPRSQPGWGIAYGGAEPWHILNVPAERMSPWDDAPDDFWQWAKAHGPGLGWPQVASAGRQSYLPRRLFGHYVQTRFEEARQSSAITSGPVVHVHQDVATGLTRDGGLFSVALAGGTVLQADQVVLATGFQPPGWPFEVESASFRLIRDPWGTGALDGIGRNDSVLLVGVGLTMIDMVYSLAERGHRGKVTAVSRHGLLPRIHGVVEATPFLLDDGDPAQGIVYCLRKLRRAIALGQADWRGAMDGLRPRIDQLWAALSPVEQDRYRRHLRPFWEVHRHRMPTESADLLLRQQVLGRLEIKSLRIQKVRASEHDVQVNGTHSFAHLINCTPPAAPLGKEASPLAQSLLATGAVRPDRTGAGFDIEPDGALRDAQGLPVPGFFTLGPPRRGHAQETTAVPHIKNQIAELVDRLLNRARL